MMILPLYLKKTGHRYILVLMALVILITVTGLSIFTPVYYVMDLALFLVILYHRYALTTMLGAVSFIVDIVQGLYLGVGLLHLIIILIFISTVRKWQHTQSFSLNWISFIATFFLLRCVDLACGMVKLSENYIILFLIMILIYPSICALSFKINSHKMHVVK